MKFILSNLFRLLFLLCIGMDFIYFTEKCMFSINFNFTEEHY